MNILVTGATGFLGTTLSSRLKTLNHNVVQLNSKNCDLTRADSLLAFNTQKYDQIFHLAAWTQAGDFCLYHPGEQWIINQQINTNVLAWWQHDQSQAKFISIGTSCSYDPNLELKEENYLVGIPIESLYTYAMTKRMLYIGQLALNRQYGLRSLTAVPSTLYGPGYHLDGRQMHFIFDLMRKIIRGELFGEQVVLWGDGYQKRELVYVEDFVSILLKLSNEFENKLVNIGAGKEFTIRQFAQIICDKVGYNFGDIVFDTNRYVGAKSKCLVVDELKKMIPDNSLTPLETGIGITLDWFTKEIEKLGRSRK
jgi:GDP-L-fucose synthase